MEIVLGLFLSVHFGGDLVEITQLAKVLTSMPRIPADEYMYSSIDEPLSLSCFLLLLQYLHPFASHLNPTLSPSTVKLASFVNFQGA